jgi:hypothetical protein
MTVGNHARNKETRDLHVAKAFPFNIRWKVSIDFVTHVGRAPDITVTLPLATGTSAARGRVGTNNGAFLISEETSFRFVASIAVCRSDIVALLTASKVFISISRFHQIPPNWRCCWSSTLSYFVANDWNTDSLSIGVVNTATSICGTYAWCKARIGLGWRWSWCRRS